MNTTATTTHNGLVTAALKTSSDFQWSITHYCDSETTKHAVGLLVGFMLSKGIIPKVSDCPLDKAIWLNMVTLTRISCHDGEVNSVTIATPNQVGQIKQHPLFNLRLCEPAPLHLSFLTPSNPKDVDVYLYDRSPVNFILAPKTSITVIDAVSRILYNFDDTQRNTNN